MTHQEMRRQRTSSRSLPSGHFHCQGCGEGHRRDEMLSLCLFCTQSKFIPRQDWLTIGFQDRKSYYQWWNHEKKFNIKNLTQAIKELQEKEKLRAAWYNQPFNREEQEDDLIMDDFVESQKVQENGIAQL